MITFERVSKRYPNGREALTHVSFNIHNGEMVFLTGRSGAGKSTVLKLIALPERPMPLELSVGEQQRVGIARAVVSKPPLLIADEPTGNLDPDLSLEVMRLFRRFQDVGVTVVVATHDLQLVREFGQRVIVLEDGRVHGGDAPDTLPSVVATR